MRLEIEQLCLDVLEGFEFLEYVARIFIRQQAEKDAFKAETFGPFGAIGLWQFASEDCLASWLRWLRRGGLLGGGGYAALTISV